MTRVPAGGLGGERVEGGGRPGGDDLAAAVDVGAHQVAARRGRRAPAPVSPPITADIAGRGQGAGRAHGAAADGGQVDGVDAGTTPAMRGGRQLADRVPGGDGAGGDVQRAGGQQRGRDDQRLGDGGVLDLVRPGGGAQPDEVQVMPLRHGRGSSASRPDRANWLEHSGFLRSLSGSDDGQHGFSQTRAAPLGAGGRHQVLRMFCRILTIKSGSSAKRSWPEIGRGHPDVGRPIGPE